MLIVSENDPTGLKMGETNLAPMRDPLDLNNIKFSMWLYDYPLAI